MKAGKDARIFMDILMSFHNKRKRQLLAVLKKIHDMAPSILCKGKCQRACGPISEAVLPLELERVRTFLRDPTFKFASADSIKGVKDGKVDCDTCPLLSPTGACSVHDVRPLICRLWGVVDDPFMRCPYGCAGALMSNAEARHLWELVSQLDQQYGAQQ